MCPSSPAPGAPSSTKPWPVIRPPPGSSMPVSQSAFCWPNRAGKRISRSQSRADLVNSRLVSWSENKSALWQGVLSRCERGKSKKVPSPFGSRHDFEKRVLGALRVGDVRKALQSFVAAPIAPKTPETFQALKELHHPQVSPSQPTMLPYSRSNTFVQLCSPSPQPLLQGCLVIALLSYSNVPEQNPSISSPP